MDVLNVVDYSVRRVHREICAKTQLRENYG